MIIFCLCAVPLVKVQLAVGNILGENRAWRIRWTVSAPWVKWGTLHWRGNWWKDGGEHFWDGFQNDSFACLSCQSVWRKNPVDRPWSNGVGAAFKAVRPRPASGWLSDLSKTFGGIAMSFQPPFAVGSTVTHPEICAAFYREVSDLDVKSRLLVSSKPQE